MRVTIAAVGRLKDGGERVLVDRYLDRLALAKSIGIAPVREVEVGEGRGALPADRRIDEATRLAKAVAEADALVVLDPKGRSLTSEAFAAWLGARRDAGTRHMAFVIGGPDGHGAELLARSALTLAFGAMTLPHGLARVVLAEQIYRAVTILSGHPYHRG